MTIRVEDDGKDRLDRLAESTQRSKSFSEARAIREIIENNAQQVAESKAALKEADAGDFASDKDVAALAKTWKTPGRVSAGSMAVRRAGQPGCQSST